jgi:radical SAM superfamily enzyme with C-terminal helix-hairpin-helix motif
LTVFSAAEKIKVKAAILDCYVDEPACLGVPPYLSPYPRYVAGAVAHSSPGSSIRYFTVDQLRKDASRVLPALDEVDLLVVIAGVAVPGKYLGGTPADLKEITHYIKLISKPVKVLGGPAAAFGCGVEGGELVERPDRMVSSLFDVVVNGDVEVAVAQLVEAKLDEDRVDRNLRRIDGHGIFHYAVEGAEIAKQHPNYPETLICEVETYRGCPRCISGGCSFCIEPLYGLPDFRPIEDVIAEIKALYDVGVRHFRLGRQPDIFSYMATGVGENEFPNPNPDAIRRLFEGIRSECPGIETLHIDNANPGVIARYPKECEEIAKIIIRYHTPGDVAAFGVESVDPVVIEKNNLKAQPEQTLQAIELINKVGAVRGSNGLPELLPGINFVYGLIGETQETYKLNLEFMKELLKSRLLVRRINIRQVIPFPNTKMSKVGNRIIKKNKRIFAAYKEKMRNEVDLPMLRKLVPVGTVLRRVRTEGHEGNLTYARQVGTYPLLVTIPEKVQLGEWIDTTTVGHGYRSVTGVPYPLDLNTASPRLLQALPRISQKEVFNIMRERPINSLDELRKLLQEETFNQVRSMVKI